MAPFGVAEIVAAVAPAGSVLDAGCGSARLTLALADAGAAEVVGIDTSVERLAQGRARISTHAMGARVKLIAADFDRELPFPDGRFGAAVSRLALMIAIDPVATLRELRRVTGPGGRIVTALWAPVGDNPWFALTRAATAAVVGRDRADYARVRAPRQPGGGRRGPSRRRARRRIRADAAADARRAGRRRPVGQDGARERSCAPPGRGAQRFGARSGRRRAGPAGRRPPHARRRASPPAHHDARDGHRLTDRPAGARGRIRFHRQPGS